MGVFTGRRIVFCRSEIAKGNLSLMEMASQKEVVFPVPLIRFVVIPGMVYSCLP